MPLPELPSLVLELASLCREHGGKAYLVGGCVRDFLLQKPIKDHDVEVFGLEAHELLSLLKRLGQVNLVGRSFGVVKLTREGIEIDVSIPRADSKVGAGHRGIAVVGDPFMSVEEACRRRDLTVNAMLLDLMDGRLVDPYEGQRDLQQKRLRAVDAQTFLEDPLRALRVVQFIARLGFSADESLHELCARAALSELPAERIRGELEKMLLRGTEVGQALAFARSTGALFSLFPELEPYDKPQFDDRLVRLAKGAREQVAPGERKLALMYSGWLAHVPGAEVESVLDRLGVYRAGGFPLRRKVLEVVEHCGATLDGDEALRRLSVKAEVGLVAWIQWAAGSQEAAQEALSRAQQLGVTEAPPAPWVQGRDLLALGMTEGPELGKAIDALYDEQLSGSLSTRLQALERAAELFE